MDPSAANHFGRKIGRYEVVGKLAQGGMAEILLGRLVGPFGFEKLVVIKRILSHMADEPSFVAMFRDEAQILAGLRHPNIVQVFEFGIDDSGMFLVMEYLEGETVGGVLRRLYGRGSTLDPAAAASIAAAACAGLHAAHEHTDAQGRPRQLVHRDIAPDNLFLTYEGEVKLLDFGVAKAEGRLARTETGGIKGTRPYMSPQQALAEPIDRRSDIFSLGIVLFEMCSMRRLFHRENPLLALRAICSDPIPSLIGEVKTIPRELDAIARKALERRVEDRYQTAQEMRRDLLSAARLLTPREPTELLAALMGELFDDRQKEKTELKQVLQQGMAPPRLPQAVVDLETTMPPVGLQDSSGEKTLAGNLWPRRRPGLARIGAVAAVCLTSAAAVMGWLRPLPKEGRGAAEVAARQEPISRAPGRATAETAATSEVTPSGSTLPTSTAVAPARIVTIEVLTTPDGARVLVAGRERGKTPLRLPLPVSTEAVPVDLLREGFIPYRLDVRPDVDQKYVVNLEHYRAAPRRPPVAGSATASAPSVAETPPAATLSAVPAPVAVPVVVPPPPASASSAATGFRRFDEPSVFEGRP